MESQLKALPSVGAGFVPVQQMAKRPDLPFNKAWIKQGVNWQQYRIIYIAPVNTNYLIQATWWQQRYRGSDAAGRPEDGNLHANAIYQGLPG